jgi:ATP-dependent DNA helicase PIF1
MTINKGQGQTLDKIGLDLTEEVFNHGQLYVGISRVSSWDCIKILLNKECMKNKITRNIVYKEILDI